MGERDQTWEQVRRTPDRLARRAAVNLSDSVVSGRSPDRSVTELLNIVSNLVPAKMGSGLMIGGLGMMQKALPGVNPVWRGLTPIAGRRGFYAVDPSQMTNDVTREWIMRAEKRIADEADLAERGVRGIVTNAGEENAKGANMLLGALNDMRFASMKNVLPRSKKDSVKGMVVVDDSGNVVGGSAIDTKKAGEYLGDTSSLDFTKVDPNYLEYVSTVSPRVKGSDILRETQKLYGDDLVFQVYNPTKNIPIYEAMGARPIPRKASGADALGGHEGLPAYRIEARIPEKSDAERYQEFIELLETQGGQQRLPGFRKGGLARMKECHCG